MEDTVLVIYGSSLRSDEVAHQTRYVVCHGLHDSETGTKFDQSTMLQKRGGASDSP
jgi:hypothetical protein